MNKKKRVILRLIMIVIIAAGLSIPIHLRRAPDNELDLSQPGDFDINHAVDPQGHNTGGSDPALNLSDEEKQAFIEESSRLGSLYKDLFLQAEKTPSSYWNANDDLTQPWKDRIEDVLIEAGYALINTDSVYPDYLEASENIYRFWESVVSDQDANTGFWGISSDGGLYYTGLSLQDGKAICTHASAKWNDRQELELSSMEKREVYFWSMTQGMDFYYQDLPRDRHWTATKLIRLKPADRTLYDLNMKYIEPIGYHNVNLFLLDWEQNNYGNVCFNDLLHGLWRAEHGDYLYTQDYPHADEPFFHCQIPAELFEDTVWKHFDISLDAFRQRSLYDPESNTYPCLDIGMNDSIYYPSVISEVDSCERIDADTIKLTVRVMCLDYHSDRVLTHEVTIRELPDGGWQYLSNRILARDNVEQPSPHARIEAQWFQTVDRQAD